MAEREAFIRAIAENLYDDTPRLAFADWLDEHGDHNRAEFIRVQCELEPMRDKYEIPRAAELHERERHFGSRGTLQHDEVRGWLGAMPERWDDWDVGISIEFRRGFPDILALSAKMFLEHGATIRTLHPTIRRVVIHCLNGWGDRLAACEELKGLAELELACWYADDDMKAMAASPHLGELQLLELWLGRRGDVGTDANLCKLTAKGKAWPKLRTLTLLDPEGYNEKRIKRLVASVNRSVKRKLARYERGYPELFPLNADFYSAWPVVGRLFDGRAAVVDRKHTSYSLRVRPFDTTGAPTGEELFVPLPDELAQGANSGNTDREFMRAACAAIGFVPGFIRVQENALGEDYGPWRGHDNYWEERCGLGDNPEDPSDYNGDPDPNGIGGRITWLMRKGEFIIRYDAWADKRGEVHST
jgi:uncharacterized protein (TIGR02996 family)